MDDLEFVSKHKQKRKLCIVILRGGNSKGQTQTILPPFSPLTSQEENKTQYLSHDDVSPETFFKSQLLFLFLTTKKNHNWSHKNITFFLLFSLNSPPPARPFMRNFKYLFSFRVKIKKSTPDMLEYVKRQMSACRFQKQKALDLQQIFLTFYHFTFYF